MYKPIGEALEKLSDSSQDTKTITEARGFQSYFSKPEAIAALIISEEMLKYTKQLSVKLQGMSGEEDFSTSFFYFKWQI